MSKRQQQKEIALHTVNILNTGFYVSPNGSKFPLNAKLTEMMQGTTLYAPKDGEELVSNLQPSTQYTTAYRVTQETTLQAAKRLVRQSPAPLLVLNFASAKNPGGGFLNGSTAQEESLARSSGLILSLESQPTMYRFNRNTPSAFYSDYMIYSPSVPVFKDDAGKLAHEPYTLSFITAPAVNKGAVLNQNSHTSQADIDFAMRTRIEKILAVAAHHGYERLLLGAFGCGVFRNEPVDVARIFKECLDSPRFAGRFQEVSFAVLDHSPSGAVIQPFRQAFS